MSEELLYELFELLHREWVTSVAKPTRMVGVQGDSIVVFQKGGEHFGIRLVPVKLGAPSV